MPISQQSCSSLVLEPRSDDTSLGTATGFVVRRGRRAFLVTNRHVLRGRRQDNDQPLHPSAALPNNLVIVHNQAGAPGRWIIKIESLVSARGKPRWFEHPTFNGAIDVVCLPLSEIAGVDLFPYDPWDPGVPLRCGPSDAVSIIGFPFGVTAGGALGVWVQGTLASEPDVDFNNQPLMLVDSRTRPGQSGSPVIAYRSGGMVPLDDGSTVAFNGPVFRFLGVYSGRISAESDLGFVWKAQVVREIIEAIP